MIESPRDYGTQARKCHRSCSRSVSLSDPQHTPTHPHTRSTSLIMRLEKVPPRPVPKFAADDRFKACCRQAEMHSCDLSLFLEFDFSSLIMRGIKFEPEPATHTSVSLFLFIVCGFRLIPPFVKSDRPKKYSRSNMSCCWFQSQRKTNDSDVGCFSVVPCEVVDYLFVTVFNFPVLHKLS